MSPTLLLPPPEQKLHIVVVGGSLAALLSSIPLLRLGHSVTILERSSTPLLHSQGAGVVVGSETQAFFRVHDRSGREIAVVSRERVYLGRDGGVVDVEGSVQRMTSWDLLYDLGRGIFDGVGSREDREGEASYEYGRLVTGVRDLGGKVEVEYQDVRELDDGGEGPERKNGSVQADFLIVADGPSSQIRQKLFPESPQRTYAGYVAFRGTIPEAEMSLAAKVVFTEKFTFFHARGTQILAYTIPGPGGTLEVGKRLVNWVWYCNYDERGAEYGELMTDADGNRHRFTVPTGGKMQARIWECQKEKAKEVLPPQFAEIVTGTRKPFVQAITDLEPARPVRLLGGKGVLVGDALSGFRPHTAASTSQAAYHALLLERVFKDEMSWDEYEEEVQHFAHSWQKRGVILGTRSQFGHHPFQGHKVSQGSPTAESLSRTSLNLREE